VDVQPDRSKDGRAEHALQRAHAMELVLVVDSAQGRCLALIVRHMAEVMQEAGGNKVSARARRFSKLRGLQRVLELSHRFAAVLAAAPGVEKRLDLVEG